MNLRIRDSRRSWPVGMTLSLLVIVLISACGRTPVTKQPGEGIPQTAIPEISDAMQREIVTFCSACHAMPLPTSFPKSAWYDEVKRGFEFYFRSNRKDLIPPPMESVVEYFRSKAPTTLDKVPDQSVPGPERIGFRLSEIFVGPSASVDARPASIAVVSRWPAAGTDKLNLLFNDMASGCVYAADPKSPTSVTHCLARLTNPASACRCDLNGNGQHDLVVADLGSFNPADHDRGRVVWVPDAGENHPAQPGIAIAEGLGRVADVQPADFDGDGDIDLVVAEFGWHKTGHLFWLRNDGTLESPKFVRQVIDSRPGAIHVPVVDLNHDARPDFVALIAQEFEVIEAYLNQGDGSFAMHVIHAAGDPAFGSSGIQVVDMDGDGDEDVLYTNGDMFDSFLIKPYHGIQWLENSGTYPFVPHPLTKFPGVHRALAADLDRDGDVDIVAAAFLPASVRETEAGRKLESLIWLEQTSAGKFVRHPIETGSCIHAAMDLADFDGDGDLDIAAGSFGDASSQNRPAVKIWWNDLSAR